MNDLYSELYHHGIKGQKWGVRRYQNPDGSLTAEGLALRAKSGGDTNKNSSNSSADSKKAKKQQRNKKLKTAVIIGASLAAAALAGYGIYRYAKANNTNSKTASNLQSLTKIRNQLESNRQQQASSQFQQITKPVSSIPKSPSSSGVSSKGPVLTLGSKDFDSGSNAGKNIINDMQATLDKMTAAAAKASTITSSAGAQLDDLTKKLLR